MSHTEMVLLAWAATLAFCCLLFLAVGIKLMRLTAAENYERGKEDGKPIRLSNGQLVGRR